jgi:DNA repair protein RecO (recombination protein O)
MDFSEYDYIIDFLTRDHGKLSAIAKNAKKSKKRFAGVLEPFSCLEANFSISKRGNLLLLKEAVLTHPFAGLRKDAEKLAYASYWSEMINRWVVGGGFQQDLFPLFFHALTRLDTETASRETVSLLFQTRFMNLAGMSPELNYCRICRRPLDDMAESQILFDIPMGGLVCGACIPSVQAPRSVFISKGALKQLLWLKEGNLQKAARIQLTPAAKREGAAAMEMFVPFHLSAEIKSLKVLRCLREWRQKENAPKYKETT